VLQCFVIARVPNHAERDVTAVYDRHSYDAEKRTALEAWARKPESIVSGEALASAVVPFSRAQSPGHRCRFRAPRNLVGAGCDIRTSEELPRMAVE
jgi:hypothetical protein